MPGLIGDQILGVKLVGSVFSTVDPKHKHTTCMMMIWDAMTLRVRGLLAADRLNEHRTAAGFAAGTDRLARRDARTHLIMGAGKLAYTSALYVNHVRPTDRLILVSRSKDKVLGLAARVRSDPRLDSCEIVTEIALDEAVAHADIITTVTTSEQPVFDGRYVKAGTHINLGGAGRPHEREMDDAVASRASFWLDSSESCRARTGDIMVPLASGVLTEGRIVGELGETLLGLKRGRASDDEITVFKSLGVATQDLVLGARLLDLAEQQGFGLEFDEKNA
jgi:ornithine cyclodeaminase